MSKNTGISELAFSSFQGGQTLKASDLNLRVSTIQDVINDQLQPSTSYDAPINFHDNPTQNCFNLFTLDLNAAPSVFVDKSEPNNSQIHSLDFTIANLKAQEVMRFAMVITTEAPVAPATDITVGVTFGFLEGYKTIQGDLTHVNRLEDLSQFSSPILFYTLTKPSVLNIYLSKGTDELETYRYKILGRLGRLNTFNTYDPGVSTSYKLFSTLPNPIDMPIADFGPNASGISFPDKVLRAKPVENTGGESTLLTNNEALITKPLADTTYLTLANIDEEVYGAVKKELVAGKNVTITPDDTNLTLTIADLGVDEVLRAKPVSSTSGTDTLISNTQQLATIPTLDSILVGFESKAELPEDIYTNLVKDIKGGANINITPDNANNTITISASASFSPTQQDIYPAVKPMLIAGANTTLTPNDTNSTITIASAAPTPPFVPTQANIYPVVSPMIVADSTISLVKNPTTNEIGFGAVLSQANLYAGIKPTIVAGANTTITPNDTNKTLTIASAAPTPPFTPTQANIYPALKTMFVNVSNMTIIPNDTNSTIGLEAANPDADNIYPIDKQILVAGTNVTLTPNDTNKTITINASGGGTGGEDTLLRAKGVIQTTGQTTLIAATEPLITKAAGDATYLAIASIPTEVYGVNKVQLVAGSNVTLTPNDTTKTITIAAAGGTAPDPTKEFTSGTTTATNQTRILSSPDGKVSATISVDNDATGVDKDFIEISSTNANAGSTKINAGSINIKHNVDVEAVAFDTHQVAYTNTSGNSNSKTWIDIVTQEGPTLDNIYPIDKLILKAGTNVTIAEDDTAKTLTISSTGGGSPTKIFTSADTQSTVFTKVNVGDFCRFTADNGAISYFSEPMQGYCVAKDATTATFMLRKESGDYDEVRVTVTDGTAGQVDGELANNKIGAGIGLGDEFMARIDDVKSLITTESYEAVKPMLVAGADIKVTPDDLNKTIEIASTTSDYVSPWTLFTAAQYLVQVNQSDTKAQQIVKIPIDMTGAKPNISFGYTVQVQMNDNSAATGVITHTSSRLRTTYNAYINATLPDIAQRVLPEYSGDGAVTGRHFWYVDKTDAQQWYFCTYLAVSNFSNDHYDWFEFHGAVEGAQTVGLKKEHIIVPDVPVNRYDPSSYQVPTLIDIDPNWTEFKQLPSINLNYNNINALTTRTENLEDRNVKIDATTTYVKLSDFNSTTNPLLTLAGAPIFTPTQANLYPEIKPMLKAGTNTTITPDDANSTLTITATGGGTSGEDDVLRAKGVADSTGVVTLLANTENLITANKAEAVYAPIVSLPAVVYTNNKTILKAGSNVVLTPTDATSTILIDAAAPTLTNTYPVVKDMLVAGINITLTPNDTNDTITIASTGGSSAPTQAQVYALNKSIFVVPTDAPTKFIQNDTASTLTLDSVISNQYNSTWPTLWTWAYNGGTPRKDKMFVSNPLGSDPIGFGRVESNDGTTLHLSFFNGKHFELWDVGNNGTPATKTYSLDLTSIIKNFPDTAGWSDIYAWGINNIGDLFVATPNGTQPECYGQVISKDASNNLTIRFIGGDQYQEIVLASSSGNPATKGPLLSISNSQANHYPISKQILVAGTNVAITANDSANTLTLSTNGIPQSVADAIHTGLNNSINNINASLDTLLAVPTPFARDATSTNQTHTFTLNSTKITGWAPVANDKYVFTLKSTSINSIIDVEAALGVLVQGQVLNGRNISTNLTATTLTITALSQNFAVTDWQLTTCFKKGFGGSATPFVPTQANLYSSIKPMLVAGTNSTISPNDTNNTLTVNANISQSVIYAIAKTMLIGSNGLVLTPSDTNSTITFDTSAMAAKVQATAAVGVVANGNTFNIGTVPTTEKLTTQSYVDSKAGGASWKDITSTAPTRVWNNNDMGKSIRLTKADGNIAGMIILTLEGGKYFGNGGGAFTGSDADVHYWDSSRPLKITTVNVQNNANASIDLDSDTATKIEIFE